MGKDKISESNSEFWNELCGSNHAKSLGIHDSSIKSLKIFDDWYFEYYPYLLKHIPFSDFKDKRVLEIGLGYGTISQKIAESGSYYIGLDIAKGPVVMVNQRLEQNNLAGEALQGNILDPNFHESSFDYIVAIGCLHHTGNFSRALDQCYNLLKPGGKLIFMVYYAYSYRRFCMVPLLTVRHFLAECIGFRDVVSSVTESQRTAYDASSDGQGAPYTDWLSVRSLKYFCSKFGDFKCSIENINQEWPFSRKPRSELLKTILPSIIGLDIYATATK